MDYEVISEVKEVKEDIKSLKESVIKVDDTVQKLVQFQIEHSTELKANNSRRDISLRAGTFLVAITVAITTFIDFIVKYFMK